jgi:hypothetical protein
MANEQANESLRMSTPPSVSESGPEGDDHWRAPYAAEQIRPAPSSTTTQRWSRVDSGRSFMRRQAIVENVVLSERC